MAKIENLIKQLCRGGVEYRSIGSLIKRTKERAKDSETIKQVYVVSNVRGMVREEDFRESAVHSEDTSNYWVVRPNMFAYNPSRLNIGSIAMMKTNEPGLVSPMYVVFSVDESLVTKEYFSYAISSSTVMAKINSYKEEGARFRFDFGRWDWIRIPVPPLEVQQEIVQILDQFTQLTAELTAELTARKQQFEYYCDKILTFSENVPTVALGDVAVVTKLAGFEFTKYVHYSDSGRIIALRGLNVKNGKLDLSDVKYIDNSDFSKLTRSKLHIGDMLFTYVGTVGQVALVDEEDKYYLAPNVALIRSIDDRLNPQFMRYYFQSNGFWKTQINKLLQSSSMKNIPMEKIRKFEIPLPPLSEQRRIVAILDRFDALCNDLTSGLPAEIAARQKQYEYYRDKLLTFPERKN